MTNKRILIIPLLILLFASASCVVYADDGYDLWLKYNKVSDAQKLAEYQAAITSVVIQGDSPTCNVMKDELQKGLSGLLGKDIAFGNSVEKAGTLIVGTPENSDIVAKLNLSDSLEAIGDEGYIIKKAQIDGKDCIVISANKDVALLYGAFNLLRMIQTQQSLDNIDISSSFFL